MTTPVFEVVLRFAAGTGEVGNLVLGKAVSGEIRDRLGVQIGDEVVSGDFFGAVATAVDEEFAAQARFVVHLEHVDAGVIDAGFGESAERFIPGVHRLPGQTGDEVNADIVDTGSLDAANIFKGDGAIVQAPDGFRFAVDKRLHAEADARNATFRQGLEGRGLQLPRSALDGDFRGGQHSKLTTQAGEETPEESGRE